MIYLVLRHDLYVMMAHSQDVTAACIFQIILLLSIKFKQNQIIIVKEK